MSQHDASRNNPNRQSEESSSANMDDAADTGSANNSIIGKVKSRVSSILPNSLSKWFSPSTKSNDSMNGSFNRSCGTGSGESYPRRRRRIELDNDEVEGNSDDVEEDDTNDEELHYILEGNTSKRHSQDNSDDDDEEDSNNSDEEATPPSKSSASAIINITRGSKAPPAKRSRFDLEVNKMRDSPLIQRQPLVASTPSNSGNERSTHSQTSTMCPSGNRYSHMNLYSTVSRKDEIYNFPSLITAKEKRCTARNAIGDVKGSMQSSHQIDTSPNSVLGNIGMNSCRSQNILTHSSYAGGLSNLKRQSLASVKNDLPSTSTGIVRERFIAEVTCAGALPKRTSTTIFEAEDPASGIYEDKTKHPTITEEGEQQVEVLEADNDNDQAETSVAFNGLLSTTALIKKRRKFINGGQHMTVKSGASDTVSECSENARRTNMECMDLTEQQKGLFNTSAANIQSADRADLNFYTHLEGRKSLFAGDSRPLNSGNVNQGAPNVLNNSTLSLTSLNRRQFNASIYGSTSALSDSRLLNTFSPFYKGRTTYGGASAYHKYNAVTSTSVEGARIARTHICPTSSLSTLSSSNNSLGTIGAASGVVMENTSAISSTAKRILDLINDFATPLSEAKKMANNLKSNQQHHLSQAKSRLNENDLQSARAQRLAHVRKPYVRPVITLQPIVKTTHFNNGKDVGLLPPVRELQVPSMSQLLQMKKLQSSTERSRQITTKQQQLATKSYALPIAADKGGDGHQTQKKQHISKIKSAKHNQMHMTAVRELEDELLPPVNLPNIVFPLMKSVPKIDIPLPQISNMDFDAKEIPKQNTTTAATWAFKTSSVVVPKSPSVISDHNTTLTKKCEGHFSNSQNVTVNFKFSPPLTLACTQTAQLEESVKLKFTFSDPAEVPNVPAKGGVIMSSTPVMSQLKNGSVLDALKNPFVLPISNSSSVKTKTSEKNGFGQQFKKTEEEWECDCCMLRNKKEVNKCAACETLRNNSVNAPTAMQYQDVASTTDFATSTAAFGSQFKKSSREWDCQTCMIRNKKESTKCIACETPHNDASMPQQPVIKSTFGDSFKPKANTWECPTCLIMNQDEVNECLACQTKKPEASSSDSTNNTTPTYNFGSTPKSTSITTITANADAGFISLAAAQKNSKWECEACMTLNEALRSKCVCCDQAKPGTQDARGNAPKFSFGTTASAKFSFGFGAAAGVNGSKEADLRKAANTALLFEKTNTSSKSTEFVFGTKGNSGASSTFNFGIKQTTDTGKDVDDNTATLAETTKSFEQQEAKPSFKFGICSVPTSTNSTSSSTAVSTEGIRSGIFIGSNTAITTKTTEMITHSSSPTAADAKSTVFSSPRVKFSLSTTNSPATSIVPTFSFSSPAVSSSISTTIKTGGCDYTTLSKPATAIGDINKSLEVASALTTNFNLKTTSAAAGSATNASILDADVSKIKPAVTKAGLLTTTTLAAKPIFSFGVSSISTASTSSATFSFGNTSTSAAANTFFPSVTSAATSTSSVCASVAPTSAVISSPATKIGNSNIFGSSSSSPKAETERASEELNPKSNIDLFGSPFANVTNESKSLTTNSFSVSMNESKPMASASPIFEKFTNTAGQLTATSTSFVFGGSARPTTTPTTGLNTPSASTGASVSTWPKSGFVFGNVAVNSTTDTNGNESTAKSVFGSFSSESTVQTSNQCGSIAGSSIFGNMSPAPITSSGFGNIASSGISNTTGLFGKNAAPSNAAASSATSLFNAPITSAASATSTVAFGVLPFGGSITNTPVSTFSGFAAGTTNFGNFNVTSSTVDTVSKNDGASAPKKSDATFNFSSTNSTGTATQQGSSSGFNFGTASGKPAFNFAPANQPAFNFTGSTETLAAKPFQFGATPSAPMFNFSAGATEAMPNAPFQFNAGASPATNNIFAPTPTLGAPSSQQARRKIRAPNRRLTPR